MCTFLLHTVGEDFPSPTQLLVTFKAGLTRSNPISVPITDDKMFEDREKFYITIKPSPSLSYLPGSPSEVAINIQDNESMFVSCVISIHFYLNYS